jgi:hypothetical protein
MSFAKWMVLLSLLHMKSRSVRSGCETLRGVVRRGRLGHINEGRALTGLSGLEVDDGTLFFLR